MEIIGILSTAIAAAIGALLPLSRELLAILIRRGIGAKFFRDDLIGRQIVKAFGVELSDTAPEALFKALSAASEKMDGIVKQAGGAISGLCA